MVKVEEDGVKGSHHHWVTRLREYEGTEDTMTKSKKREEILLTEIIEA